MLIRIIQFVLTLMVFKTFSQEISIYEGKQGSQYVYYDPMKADIIIEFGYKYLGVHDTLNRVENNSTLIAKSQNGTLYRENEEFLYKNDYYNIDVKLDKKEYTDKIDYRRLNIFQLVAEETIKDLVSANDIDFKFDQRFAEEVRDEYKFFRDNPKINEEYIPKYIVRFFDEKSTNK